MSEYCEHHHFACCCGKDCDTCPYRIRIVKEYRITNPKNLEEREEAIKKKIKQMIYESENALFPLRLRWGIDKSEDIKDNMKIFSVARNIPNTAKHIIILLFSNGGVSYRFA